MHDLSLRSMDYRGSPLSLYSLRSHYAENLKWYSMSVFESATSLNINRKFQW